MIHVQHNAIQGYMRYLICHVAPVRLKEYMPSNALSKCVPLFESPSNYGLCLSYSTNIFLYERIMKNPGLASLTSFAPFVFPGEQMGD